MNGGPTIHTHRWPRREHPVRTAFVNLQGLVNVRDWDWAPWWVPANQGSTIVDSIHGTMRNLGLSTTSGRFASECSDLALHALFDRPRPVPRLGFREQTGDRRLQLAL